MASTALAGCEGTGQNQQIGTVAGAVTGAAIGTAIGARRGGTEALVGGLIGALVGGVVGGLVGKAFDDRNKRLAELSKSSGIPLEARTYQIPQGPGQPAAGQFPGSSSQAPRAAEPQTVEQARQQLVYTATVPDAQFESGSADLTPAGRAFFDAMADAYSRDGRRKVLIVGHTDASGNPAENQRLSEARALTVARVFQRHGFNANDLYYQGAGSAEPVADDSIPEGRAKNRRVDVADGADEEALLQYKRIVVAESKKVQAAGSTTSTPPVQITPETAPSVTTQPPNALQGQPPATALEPALTPKRPIDLGGVPWTGDITTDFGASGFAPSEPSSVVSRLTQFISSAKATEAIPPFLKDQIIEAGSIKSLSGGKNIDIRYTDVSPGYFRQPFYAQVERHFVDLAPVTIWKAGDVAEPASLDLYINYDRGRSRTPTSKISGSSKLYQSDAAFLYRWRATQNDFGIIGVEIKSPKLSSDQTAAQTTFQAPSRIWYARNGQIFVRDIELRADLVKMTIKGGL